MDPKTHLQYFRNERQDIRRFLEQFKAALNRVHSKLDEHRRKGLGELREICNLTFKPFSITAIRQRGTWSLPIGPSCRVTSSSSAVGA